MTTTFNGLVLDELGTIGNPVVEYANFIAETKSPAGYDGAVLTNFKRDYTTIQFDLTLDGTESECLNKLNTLVGALNAGEGELVMPGQAERGTHFNAVPNMSIAHSLRGFDGMTVPMTFIVPEGCAIKENSLVLTGELQQINAGYMPAQWELTASGTTTETLLPPNSAGAKFFFNEERTYPYQYAYLINHDDIASGEAIEVSMYSSTGEYTATANGEAIPVRTYFEKFYESSHKEGLLPISTGLVYVQSVNSMPGLTTTLRWKATSVW